MKNVRFIFSTLGLALFFAFTVFLPHLQQRFDSTYPFQGIEIMATDAETHYASRYHEILDGHTALGNTYYSAPKDQPSIQPPLPEWSLAMLSRALPFDPALSFSLLAAACAFILFCFAVLMSVAITGRSYESLAAVTAMLFAGAFFGTPWNLPHAILSGSFADFGWLRFSRPVNPLWTMSWFFLTVFFLSRWVRKADVLWILCAAVTTIVLLYSYFYAWTYVLATVGILFLIVTWRKDWLRVRHLLFFFMVFLLVGSAYFLHLVELTRHSWYLDSSHRQGLVPSHAPILGAWLIALLLTSFAGRGVAWRQQSSLVVALAFGGLVAINQQVLTGQHLFPEHYHWYFIQPLGVLFLVLLSMFFLQRFVQVRAYRFGIAVIIATSVLFGFLQQRDAYQTYRKDWGEAQKLAPIFAYARDHLPKDSVAYSLDSFVTDLLPVYTSMNVYTSAQAMNYLAPTERTRDALFFTLWLRGLKSAEARVQFFTTLRKTVGSGIYASYYRELRGDYGAMPDELVLKHVQEYERYHALSFAKKLSLYPLDYFIVSPSDPTTKELRSLLAGKKVLFEENGYRIIAIR